jgi:uncharacterized protein YjbI with pentapeptide repeats
MTDLAPLVERSLAREAAHRLEHSLLLLEAPTMQERIGGLYAFEGLSREAASLQETLLEVLSAFVRGRTTPVQSEADWTQGGRIDADVQAAITILGRCRSASLIDRPLDLHGISLREVYLPFAQLEKAFLYECDLEGALLCNANLRGAWLWRANLTRVNFDGADLRGADLSGARGFKRNQVSSVISDNETRWPVFADEPVQPAQRFMRQSRAR